MRRGQVAYEFIMVFFVLTVGFLAWISFASSFQEDLHVTKSLEDFTDFSLSLKHQLLVIAQMPDGFSKVIDIPVKISGRSYEIGVRDFSSPLMDYNFSSVEINSSDLGFYTYFDVPLMNDSLDFGKNIVSVKDNKLFVKKV